MDEGDGSGGVTLVYRGAPLLQSTQLGLCSARRSCRHGFPQGNCYMIQGLCYMVTYLVSFANDFHEKDEGNI